MNRTSRALKASRVKVAVRCRPAFQDEIDFAKGDFVSIVSTRAESLANKDMGQVSLATITGKQRDFHFDVVFGENATQDVVYDRLARPVVGEVLKGFNGTIFAYGQTGTGKTYTMGILEFVNNEHAGLIPRAIQQVFDHVDEMTPLGGEIIVTQSFIQLYRETIQDLLAPTSEDSLNIREDPVRGFFVEGLSEYVVRNYRESEALINLGLENRAIAPTLMNSTSSRSHTILTLRIEQRLPADPSNPQSVNRTLRSKLLMVDLAGSERVRRTVSKGARLSEAKAINSSLSALGNVITALADHSSHIPFRDSKLTRLLHDSLGGNAATALIATVGPAAINYGETLSTLLFAQRCMAVKLAPVAQETVDYAELCAKLQLQVSTMEARATEQLLEVQDRYEQTVRELRDQLEAERDRCQQLEQAQAVQPAAAVDVSQELSVVLDHLQVCMEEGRADIWFNRPDAWDLESFLLEHGEELQGLGGVPDAQLVLALGYSHELIRHLLTRLEEVLRGCEEREQSGKEELALHFEAEAEQERFRAEERAAMLRNDPRTLNGTHGSEETIGSHLAPLSKLEALSRVEGQHRSNAAPVSRYDRTATQPMSSTQADLQSMLVPRLHDYASIGDYCASLTQLHAAVDRDTRAVEVLMTRKDAHFATLKQDLADQMVERRRREEEVVNWSYILKYLLASASKLRKQAKQNGHERHQASSRQPRQPAGLPLEDLEAPPPPPPAEAPHRSNSIGDSSTMGRLFTPVGVDEDIDDIEDDDDDDDDIDQLGSRMTSRTFSASQFTPVWSPAPAPSVASGSSAAGLRAPFVAPQPSYSASTVSGAPILPQRSASALSASSSMSQSSSSGRPQPLTATRSQSEQPPSRAAVSGRQPGDGFAAQVAYQVLGIRDDSQARQAMKIIDQVQRMSRAQLDMLDAQTRAEIMQVRKELGLDALPAVGAPVTLASQASTDTKPRAQSAPRSRSAPATQHTPLQGPASHSSSARLPPRNIPEVPQRPRVYTNASLDSDEDDDFSQLDSFVHKPMYR